MQTTVRLIAIPVFLWIMMFSNANAQPHAWEQPRNVSWNKEPAHATFYLFEDAASALSKDWEQSPFHRSLNGQWKFRLAPYTDAVEPAWTAAAFDDQNWEGITVPGNWELQGFGEPIYINWEFPFEPVSPPFLPQQKDGNQHERNPVATTARNSTTVTSASTASSFPTEPHNRHCGSAKRFFNPLTSNTERDNYPCLTATAFTTRSL